MSFRYEYIERCVEALRSINGDELAGKRLEGTPLTGNHVAVHRVGSITYGSTEVYIALKRAMIRSAYDRLANELGQAPLS